MPVIPHRFLVRLAYPCRHAAGIPRNDEDRLLDLPDSYRLDNFAALDNLHNFADVRLAWNELGLGFQVQVAGKERLPMCDASRPRLSDGVTFWIDTRDARTSHRASRYCHQVHFLPAGGGPERDEPVFCQSRINRALQDAPAVSPAAVAFRTLPSRGGYLIEAFVPATQLHGFDPEQNPRLGFFYAVRDAERGEQVLSVDADFPYWEDPTLWSVLELVR
jgi:hypothetical protein